MILANQVKPGQKLVDRELARQLRVSRMPVLKALSRLQHDGLVTNRTRRGYFVADMDAKQAADLYELRTPLEVLAIRLAAERATAGDLEELRDILGTLDKYGRDPARRGDEIRLSLRVHTVIARASNNAFLYDALMRLFARMWPFIWVEVLYEDVLAANTSREEHRAFVSLIAEKRPDEAEEVLRRHLQTAKDHIINILKARENFYQEIPLPFNDGDSPR